ncbi:MAG: RICIN domain-containing protein [Saprospiraceae bacterium]
MTNIHTYRGLSCPRLLVKKALIALLFLTSFLSFSNKSTAQCTSSVTIISDCNHCYEGFISYNGGSSWAQGLAYGCVSGSGSGTYNMSVPVGVNRVRWRVWIGGVLVDTYESSNVCTNIGTYNSNNYNVCCSPLTNGGSISGNESRCGGYDPGNISNQSIPSGGNGGTIEYWWDYRNGTSGSWINISGANGSSYNPGYISQTRQYRRTTKRSCSSSGWQSSNVVTKEVINTPTPQVTVTQPTCLNPNGTIQITNLPNGFWSSLNGTWTYNMTVYGNLTPGTYQVGIGSNGCDEFASVTINQPPAGPNLVCEYRVNGTGGWNLGDCTAEVCVGEQLQLSVNPNNQAAYQWAGPNGYSFGIQSLPNGYLCTGNSVAYRLRARHSNKVMEVAGGGTGNGTNIQQNTYNGTDAQHFYLLDAGNDYFYLINVNSNLAVDVQGGGTNNGDNIRQWTLNNSIAQRFRLQSTGDGWYQIINMNSNRAVDVDGVSTADGANIHQWSITGGQNQHWGFELVSGSCSGGGEALISNNIAPVHAGTYTVTVTNSSGCTAVQSISVLVNTVSGGTIAGNQTVCSGGDPGAFTSPTAGTAAGTRTYRWESSPTDCNTGFTTIASATAATYTPPAGITQTTYFRRITISTLNGVACEAASNCLTVAVVADPAITAQPTGTTICSGGTASLSVAATGGTPSLNYQWQSSTDNITFSNIAGATASSYTTPALSSTTYYRAVVSASGNGCGSVTSSAATVTVVADPAITAQPTGTTICSGGTASLSVTATGGTPSLGYQWQSSTDNVTFANIAGATSSSYTSPALATTAYYRVVVSATGNGCGSVTSSSATVTVVADPTITAQPTDSTICSSGMASLSVTATSGTPSLNYQWQSSTDNVTFNNIVGATSSSYTSPALASTTYYRAVVSASGNGCGSVTSNAAAVTIGVCGEVCDNGIDDDGDGLVDCADPDCANSFTVNTNATATTICRGENTTISASASGGTGPYTYNWSGGLGSGISHNITPLTTTTYTVTVTSAPGCTSTAQVTITVNFCQENCTDGIDNDGDGLVDCDDPDCGLSLTATPTDASCGINDGQVTITASNGSSSYEYSANNSTWQASNVFSGLAPGTYTFYARNDNGTCAASVDATVASGCELCTDGIDNDGDGLVDCNDPDCAPNASAGPNTSICTGTGTTLTASATGGTAPYTFAWGNGLGAGATKAVSPGSTTTYTVTVTSATGCSSTAQVTVTVTVCSENCTDGIDNDGDGLVDCADPDCIASSAPQLVDDVFSTCPGMGSYGNLVSVNDGNLQSPVFTIVTPPAKGTININNFGAFNYTPADSQCGSVGFTYQVCNASGCCATATAVINFGDSQPPVLQNIPPDITISCDDEVPQPPAVIATDFCPYISISVEDADDQGSTGACGTYTITRTWTATDLCGNSASDSQLITVQDQTSPEMFRVYTLPNGKKMVAGNAERTSHLWKYVKFPTHFDAPPLVFAQVATENDAAPVTVQTRYISTTGFEVRLREEEAADQLHGGETVSWMATEPGNVDSGYKMAAQLLNNVNHNDQGLAYPLAFSSKPVFIASVNGVAQADPVSVRTKSETATGLTVSLQEEQSADSETAHANEKLAWLAMTHGAYITDENGNFVAESGTLSTNHGWATVSLANSFTKPVVLLGGLSTNGSQAATIRVRNVTPTSFEVRVQEWDYLNGIHANETMSYLVVEGSIPTYREFYCFNDDGPLQLGVDVIAIDNCDGQVAFDYTELEEQLAQGLKATRTWAAQDDCGNVDVLTRRDTCPVAAVRLKTLLSGAVPVSGNDVLMNDALRTKQLVPLKEPYSGLSGFQHHGMGGGETASPNAFWEEGAKAVEDWIFVECRAPGNDKAVLSTCSVLLRRDGSTTTANGDSILYFWDLPEGDYYVAARHRNHLGLMTDGAWYLSSDGPPTVDLAKTETAVWGGSAAGKPVNGKRAMWSGDYNGDGRAIYQGPYNDVFFLFSKVMGDPANSNFLANYISIGYNREDFDLDGRTIYQGPGNERSQLLFNATLAHPLNTGGLANYIVKQGLP